MRALPVLFIPSDLQLHKHLQWMPICLQPRLSSCHDPWPPSLGVLWTGWMLFSLKHLIAEPISSSELWSWMAAGCFRCVFQRRLVVTQSAIINTDEEGKEVEGGEGSSLALNPSFHGSEKFLWRWRRYLMCIFLQLQVISAPHVILLASSWLFCPSDSLLFHLDAVVIWCLHTNLWYEKYLYVQLLHVPAHFTDKKRNWVDCRFLNVDVCAADKPLSPTSSYKEDNNSQTNPW